MVRTCALRSRIHGSAAAAMGILLGVLLGVVLPGAVGGPRASAREPIAGSSRASAPALTELRTQLATSLTDDSSRDSPGDLTQNLANQASASGPYGSGSPGPSTTDVGSATADRTAAGPDQLSGPASRSEEHLVTSAGLRGTPAVRAPPV
ncbi:MAG: hypothetical protein ACRDP8_05275 [Actinopolymorphaceae bacterium]